jgi:hypothetical protein
MEGVRAGKLEEGWREALPFTAPCGSALLQSRPSAGSRHQGRASRAAASHRERGDGDAGEVGLEGLQLQVGGPGAGVPGVARFGAGAAALGLAGGAVWAARLAHEACRRRVVSRGLPRKPPTNATLAQHRGFGLWLLDFFDRPNSPEVMSPLGNAVCLLQDAPGSAESRA